MISALPITDAPSPAPPLAEIPSAESPHQRWLRYEAQVQELRRAESAAATALAADLQKHPGYYPAAVARNQELLVRHAERPDLRWAMVQWAEIFDTGGLPLVLQMLSDPEKHQQLLSSSPFYLMRPPLPENQFYQAHAPVSSSARHR
jgi:hypothetical protein